MKTIAIVGASADRAKYGNKALRAFRRQGYRVIPVHPSESTIEGETAYPSVLAFPGTIDEASLYVSPEVGVRVIEELAAKGVRTVWLNPGADGPAVVDRARTLGLQPIVACSILGIGESPADW